MPRRRSQRRAAVPSGGRRFAPARVIEAAWLGALILVPLLYDGKQTLAFPEQPKQFVLHLSGAVIVIAWAVELALAGDRFRSVSELWSWIGRTPARWAIAAASVFALVAVLSTLFSRTPAVSLWGQDHSDLGYELYSFLVLLVLFFAVALRLRAPAQFRRLIFTFAGVGTAAAAYGTAQHFGWDPFGPGANASRVWATFLNPVFFGSFLVMSLFMTFSAAMLAPNGDRRWTALFAVAVGLQIAALWFAGSRGPMFGAVVGGVVLAIAVAAKLGTADMRRAAIVAVGGIIVGAALILIPAGTSRGVAPLVTAFSAPEPPVGSPSAEFELPPSAATDGRFSGRVGIWTAAWELVKSRETYPPESGFSSTMRPILGFGPEMFSYSYPLEAEPYGLRGVDHAHNYPLHVLLELGAAGLVTLVVLVGLVLFTLVRVLWQGPESRPQTWIIVVAIGLLAALVGRAVEQGPGVAQISDLTGYWILMGLVIALSETSRTVAGHSADHTVRSPNQTPGLSGRNLASLATAVAVILIAGGVFLFKDIQQVRGSLAAVEANDLVSENRGSEALLKFQDAIKLAPDVSEYPIRLHEMLFNAASNESDAQNRRELLELGYDTLRTAADRDPHHPLLSDRLALATLDLYQDGLTDRRSEVIDRYLALAESQPNYPEIQALLANAAVIVGSFDLALAAADRAISLQHNPAARGRALWARGIALNGLGDSAGAIVAFEEAIAVNDATQWAGRAHGELADILEAAGRIEDADFHRQRQVELTPG